MTAVVTSRKEYNVIVKTDADIWLTVSCLECEEELEAKVHSDGEGSITVEVEPHKCKEAP